MGRECNTEKCISCVLLFAVKTNSISCWQAKSQRAIQNLQFLTLQAFLQLELKKWRIKSYICLSAWLQFKKHIKKESSALLELLPLLRQNISLVIAIPPADKGCFVCAIVLTLKLLKGSLNFEAIRNAKKCENHCFHDNWAKKINNVLLRC